jgi:hypothetical protein
VTISGRDGAAGLTSTIPAEPPLAKKPNYDYEKRRKELERKQKKDAKREDRLQRRREGTGDALDTADDSGGESEATDVPPVQGHPD